MKDNYKGDMILIDRLSEFYTDDSFSWNVGEYVKMNDISHAILKKQQVESEPFGDNWQHPCMENKPTEWHIGRILYFIKHPEEIRDIEIDNLYSGNYIFPVPVVIDGNHRVVAAMWLQNHGKMNKIHCRYGGRMDLLEYLTGEVDERPDE